jgi:chaperonin cofactor prefoldin
MLSQTQQALNEEREQVVELRMELKLSFDDNDKLRQEKRHELAAKCQEL